MKQKGLLITGGRAPASCPVFGDRSEWLVIAADSGIDTVRAYGISPDAIVGDMDSLQNPDVLEEYPEEIVTRYERAKDWTDTEIGLNFLWRQSIEDVTIVGGGGGRLDHLLGVHALFQRERYPRRWYTHRDWVEIVDNEMVSTCEVGETISFFPAGDEVATMESTGLRWPLNDCVWRPGDVGISNVCTERECRIRMLSGRLLMVRALPHHVALL